MTADASTDTSTIAPLDKFRVIQWVDGIANCHGDFDDIHSAAAVADRLFDSERHITSGVFNSLGRRVWFCGERWLGLSRSAGKAVGSAPRTYKRR